MDINSHTDAFYLHTSNKLRRIKMLKTARYQYDISTDEQLRQCEEIGKMLSFSFPDDKLSNVHNALLHSPVEACWLKATFF